MGVLALAQRREAFALELEKEVAGDEAHDASVAHCILRSFLGAA
jgi:hypothetical protein